MKVLTSDVHEPSTFLLLYPSLIILRLKLEIWGSPCYFREERLHGIWHWNRIHPSLERSHQHIPTSVRGNKRPCSQHHDFLGYCSISPRIKKLDKLGSVNSVKLLKGERPSLRDKPSQGFGNYTSGFMKRFADHLKGALETIGEVRNEYWPVQFKMTTLCLEFKSGPPISISAYARVMFLNFILLRSLT